MFSINNMFFLLTDLAANYSKQTQQKLIIPGIIFSLGAIMLIVCVLVQNINRKRKLQEAERLKRERIKKFSEEASMRFTQSQPTQEDIDRQNKFLQQSQMIEEQKRKEQEKIKMQANNSLQQQAQQNQVRQQPMQQPMQNQVPVLPTLPNMQMQAPPVVPQPMQGRPMPNAINPAVPVAGQVQTQVMPNSEVQTIKTNVPQPTMGGQILPGMNTNGIVQTKQEENTNTTNIKALVQKRIQEIEDKKREKLSGNSSKPQEQNDNTKNENIEPETKETKEVKEEQKETKPYKFEYKPEYKPGQEPPKEKVNIEIPVKEHKEDAKTDIEVNKISFNPDEDTRDLGNEKQEEKLEEQKEVKPEIKTETKLPTIPRPNSSFKTFDINGDSNKKDTEDKKENEIEKTETKTEELLKAPKVILERSETFIQADEAERDVIAKQEDQQIMIERAPVIPKIVTKKVEYNAGYLREVQNKINASREYQEAITIKEEEKDKLKKELLEKRMNLEKMKTKLKDEIKEKEQKEELSKEQISKSLLEQTEKGIVYEQGKKISLFDQTLIDNALNLDKKEIKEEQKEEPKEEIKVEEPKQETVEIKTETKIEPEVKDEPKEEIQQEVKEEKIEEPKTRIHEEEKVEEKVDEPKEDIKEEIVKQTSEEKSSSGVLNQIDYLFSSLDDEQKNKKSPQEIELEKKAQERQHREANKYLIKQMVKDAKGDDTKPNNEVDADIQKVKDNFRRMEYNQAAKELLNQTKQEEKAEAKQNEPEVKPVENIDPIRAKIRAKVEEERKRKQEELDELQAKRDAKFNKQNERTKSILGGLDLDKEILASKTKQINSLNDAPSYKKIIVVVSPDSCGKTTVAVNLAYELANRGLKTCLIDTDNIKKDIYYYIHQDKVGCLSRLNEFDDAKDMYDVGINVNDRLTVFTENKGIEYEINYSKLYKLINYAHEVNDTVIIDVKSSLGQEKTKDLLKLSTNILFVIDKKITTLNRIADKFAKTKGGFFNKDVTLVVNMDEGRGINKAAVKSIFKHLEYIENGEKKSYSIRIGEMFTIMYDTKSIITGLISQEPAVTVKENNIIADIKKIASYFYENN